MRRKIRSLLQQADFREEEIQLYLALLKSRTASLAQLQAQCDLSAATTYRTMQRLLDRKIVEAVPINHKQSLYQPLSLQALASTLSQEQRRLRRLELALQDLDGLLPYMDDDDAEPMMDVITGLDAFCQAYIDIPEKAGEEFCALGSSDSFWEASRSGIDSPLERSFVSRRLKHNVYSRALMVPTADSERIARNDSKEKRTTRLKTNLPVVNDMLMLTNDTVSYFTCDPENPRVVQVRNPEFVELQRKYFEGLWEK